MAKTDVARSDMSQKLGRGFVGIATLFLVATLPLGCLPSSFLAPELDSAHGSTTGIRQVKTDGACLGLGELQQPGVSPDEFVVKIGELLSADRRTSTRRWVQRYPDVALETLRNAGKFASLASPLDFIAQVHDEQTGVRDTHDSWQSWLRERSSSHASYEAARNQVVEHLRNHQAKEAVNLKLAAPKKLLQIDAHRLMGEALLLDNRSAEAVKSLLAAVQLAESISPYQQAQLLLLLGEAQRRSGSLEQATANWIQAVKVGESLLGRPTPVFDPGFWERAAYLRSVKATWPESLGRAFARHSRLETPTTSGSEEALLWASVGQVRLDRLEPHSALAACKRAESMLFESSMRDHMVLMQAQTLIHLNQGSTALTLLATLSTKPGSVAPRALALMGGLKLKEGNHTQSAALLTRALDYKGAKDWPGQAEAEADLGLTLLILGKEEEGLQRLRAAQKRADVTRDQEFLLECLGNEARYLEHRGKTSEAATLRTKIKQMEAGG